MKLRVLAAFSLTIIPAALTLTGCGMPANPQPPSLMLPNPVKDLTAVRTGDKVSLHWTMTRRTTDKITLVSDQDVHICRELAGKICETAGTLHAAPGKPAEFTDTLPAAEAKGQPALLTYYVELRNRFGRSAGPSNPAWTASGDAPAPVAGLSTKTVPQGILLTWQPAPAQPADTSIRIQRTTVSPSAPRAADSDSFRLKTPTEQTLAVPSNVSQALDKQPAFDQSYRYTVQRVLALNLGGHLVEVASSPSLPVTIDARDIYPPAVPSGLESVADQQGHAIDLSWTPDSDADLAGYIVYRSQSSLPAVRISGSKPVATPSYRDTTPAPGAVYTYSVSAIDRDGNESARSMTTSETLPQ
ncbi:MAG: fibronectin type III domain-containing protein [Acidobacteria bacterium]|nr:fibronectin type III domain-containing protein [Acidobacteriota bacterium]MBW4045824.1 fibronectin type III domain-containing protein [Acidobacteriota bacterium]